MLNHLLAFVVRQCLGVLVNSIYLLIFFFFSFSQTQNKDQIAKVVHLLGGDKTGMKKWKAEVAA